jgi:hypothetical protein
MNKPDAIQENSPASSEESLHSKLWGICQTLPEDYEPYGNASREEGDKWHGDCSCGCKYYLPLEGKLGADWGACCNPDSHRRGLLTFEHQGCKYFTIDETLDEEE